MGEGAKAGDRHELHSGQGLCCRSQNSKVLGRRPLCSCPFDRVCNHPHPFAGQLLHHGGQGPVGETRALQQRGSEVDGETVLTKPWVPGDESSHRVARVLMHTDSGPAGAGATEEVTCE